jgi:glycosyltransferase involved in cell wall biosynthesis
VICLTTWDHTMQRGAYEAIFLGKPVITSNFQILRQVFHKGAVHVDITVEDIVRGLLQMKEHRERYEREALELRIERLNSWSDAKKQLVDLVFYQNRRTVPNRT